MFFFVFFVFLSGERAKPRCDVVLLCYWYLLACESQLLGTSGEARKGVPARQLQESKKKNRNHFSTTGTVHVQHHTTCCLYYRNSMAAVLDTCMFAMVRHQEYGYPLQEFQSGVRRHDAPAKISTPSRLHRLPSLPTWLAGTTASLPREQAKIV